MFGAEQTLSTEEPDIVTLVVVRLTVRVALDGVADSVTVPLKPPCEVMKIVPVLQPPTGTTIVPLLVMVKSWTLTVTLAVWVRLPLAPVTVTVYVPAVPVQLSRLVPEPPVIVVVLRVHESPVAGEIDVERVTVPVKPLTGETRTVAFAGTLGVVLTVLGLANIWKSTTWTKTLLEVWLSGPLTPVKVIV